MRRKFFIDTIGILYRDRCVAYDPVEFRRIHLLRSSSSSSTWIGLERWPFMPLSMDFFKSSSKALAVSANIGIVRASGRPEVRMHRVDSRPSITGIRISIRIASKYPGAWLTKRSRAFLPSFAQHTVNPFISRIVWAISWFSSLSSARRIL